MVGRVPSDDDGHRATFMVIADQHVIYLNDEDPYDKSVIGQSYTHWYIENPNDVPEWLETTLDRPELHK